MTALCLTITSILTTITQMLLQKLRTNIAPMLIRWYIKCIMPLKKLALRLVSVSLPQVYHIGVQVPLALILMTTLIYHRQPTGNITESIATHWLGSQQVISTISPRNCIGTPTIAKTHSELSQLGGMASLKSSIVTTSPATIWKHLIKLQPKMTQNMVEIIGIHGLNLKTKWI